MNCSICHRDIGLYGWSKHVKMHKRVLGDDCYIVVKIGDRRGRRMPFQEQMVL